MPVVKKIYNDIRTARPCKRTRGFTLVELLLSMVLGAIVMGAVVLIFANLATSFAEKPTSGQKFSSYGAWTGDEGNRDIPMTPAYSQLPQAIALQAQIFSELRATKTSADLSAAVTYYGAHSVYVVTQDDGDLPAITYGPATLSWYNSQTALSVSSSAQFQALLTSNLTGAGISMDASTPGYSVFFISGTNVVDMVIHVRSYTSGSNTIYVVTTYLSGTFASELSYAYGIDTTTESTYSPITPGATRVTLRTSSDWVIYDEIGTQVIFPDPTALPYQITTTDTSPKIRTFPRFAMLLPVKQ